MSTSGGTGSGYASMLSLSKLAGAGGEHHAQDDDHESRDWTARDEADDGVQEELGTDALIDEQARLRDDVFAGFRPSSNTRSKNVIAATRAYAPEDQESIGAEKPYVRAGAFIDHPRFAAPPANPMRRW